MQDDNSVWTSIEFREQYNEIKEAPQKWFSKFLVLYKSLRRMKRFLQHSSCRMMWRGMINNKNKNSFCKYWIWSACHNSLSDSLGHSRIIHSSSWFTHRDFAFNYLAPHRGRARYCNAHVCLCVCLFVCVFAKFQSVISLWNLAYILRMGTPWLTNIFRILGQRSRS